MWVAGQLQNPVGLELRSELIPHYGVEGFITEGGDDGSGRPIFDALSFQLSNDCRQQLNHKTASTWTSSNFGIEVYLKALHIVRQSVLSQRNANESPPEI